MFQKPQTRRNFLACSTLAVVGPIVQKSVTAATATESDPKLQGAIGIVSAAAAAQLTGRATGRNFTLLELPHCTALAPSARAERDYAVTIVRNFFFSSYMLLVWGVWVLRAGASQVLHLQLWAPLHVVGHDAGHLQVASLC